MPIEYKTLNNEEINSNILGDNEKQNYQINNDLDSSSLFVPLYAQIPANKLKEICLHKFYKEFNKEFECLNKPKDNIQKQSIKNDNNKFIEDNRTFKTTNNSKKMRKRKINISSSILWISPPILINKRFDLKINSAIRHGNNLFISEYGNSYTLLQFDNFNVKNNFNDNFNDPLSISFPSFIHTISEPFYGTDHTIGGNPGNEIFFYEMASNYNEEGVMIQSFNLNNGQKMKKLIYAENIPLYGRTSKNQKNSIREYSSIDFEFDQLPNYPNNSETSSILWILYRPFSSKFSKNSTTLSVIKLAPQTLEELGHWELKNINTTEMINSFVARGVLYKIVVDTKSEENEEENEENLIKINIVPIFDFGKNKFLKFSKPLKFKEGYWKINNFEQINNISNVQYDSLTDTISVTEDGKIYLLKIYRN
ncbi:hypothetical protein ACQ4LE_000632 [Meloidogyne hapla]